MSESKTIVREEFIKRLAKRANFTINDTSDFLNALVTEFQEAVLRGDTLKITGFGKLSVTEIAEHDGYDAVNHKRIRVPPSIRVNFRLGEPIRNARGNLVLLGDDEIDT